MSPCVEKVCQLFPERAFTVSHLARNNDAFLSLCEEYDLAVVALQQLEHRGTHMPADLLRLAEYRALIEELKLDLLRQLQASDAVKRQ